MGDTGRANKRKTERQTDTESALQLSNKTVTHTPKEDKHTRRASKRHDTIFRRTWEGCQRSLWRIPAEPEIQRLHQDRHWRGFHCERREEGRQGRRLLRRRQARCRLQGHLQRLLLEARARTQGRLERIHPRQVLRKAELRLHPGPLHREG